MKRCQLNPGLRQCLEQAPHSPVAAYNAALMLETEHKGPAAAQYFYLRSARGGYAPAMLRVAGLLITGEYLEDGDAPCAACVQDSEQGFSWIQRAAKTGDDTANYLLARCYLDGIGVKPSQSSALCVLEQVSFSEHFFNPYEPSEALTFGGVSEKLRECVRRVKNLKSLPPAG